MRIFSYSFIALILSLTSATHHVYAAGNPVDADGIPAVSTNSSNNSTNAAAGPISPSAPVPANGLASSEPSSTFPATVPAPSPKAQSSAAARETSGVTLGFEERFRAEGYNNTDFNQASLDKMRQLRFRARAFADINFNDYLEGYLRIANEGYKRTSASGSEQSSPYMTGELWFDAAYLKIKKFPVLHHLSLQAGRFDIFKGDGFIFADGSALEGPRDSYFNAFDLTYAAGRSKLELIGIYDPKYDQFFPVVDAQPPVDSSNKANSGSIKGAIPALAASGKQQNEWDEAAIGFYFTNRSLQRTDIDAYTFFKKDSGDIRSPLNYLYIPDRRYTVLGGRLVHRLKQIPGLTLTGEFAYEAGAEDSMNSAFSNFDIRAWDGYGYAKKSFNVRFKPYVLSGFWALSGQDPHSRNVTSFDPVFSRWPYNSPSTDGPFWSEFYSFALTPESGLMDWTNLKMSKSEAGFTPIKPITLVVGYSHLDSMQPFAVNPYHSIGSVSPAAPAAGIFDTGVGRGQLLDVRVVYRISKSVQGFFNVEKSFPGDFYAGNDNGYWYRFDISYKFKGFLPLPHK